MQKVLVLVGPTSSGKTDLSLSLANDFDGEIISGDSIQIYQKLDIGSAKIKKEEMRNITHHLIDILPPDASFNVYDFQQLARKAIESINQKNKLPIIVGGTGLYIRSILYDYNFIEEKEKDNSYPELSNIDLYNLLKEIDPESLEKIHLNNRRRLLRAYNFYQKTGITFSSNLHKQKHEIIYNAHIIGLTLPRDELYKRINNRVDEMVKNGLIDEIEGLLKQGIDFNNQSMQAIGYKEFRPYFEGEASLQDCIEKIKKDTRHFAKKQYTFFKNQFDINWYAPDEIDIIYDEVSKWLTKN